MWSFEVHYVGVGQKIRLWKESPFSKKCNNIPPPIFMIFELHKYNVPQKNTCLYIIDLWER